MLSKCISLNEVKWLFNKFNNLETSLFTVIWNTILERINRTSKELQSTSIDLNTAVILLRSLHSYIYKLRDEFNNLEKKAKQLFKILTYSSKRARYIKQYNLSYSILHSKRKLHFEETDQPDE